ncbi:hypothetical protein MTO96_014201 [Rhipicephalus appendiculatus]
MVFLLPAGAHCVFLIDVCCEICSDLSCQYLHLEHARDDPAGLHVIQPFQQDVRGRPFLSRQCFISLLAPFAF